MGSSPDIFAFVKRWRYWVTLMLWLKGTAALFDMQPARKEETLHTDSHLSKGFKFSYPNGVYSLLNSVKHGWEFSMRSIKVIDEMLTKVNISLDFSTEDFLRVVFFKILKMKYTSVLLRNVVEFQISYIYKFTAYCLGKS